MAFHIHSHFTATLLTLFKLISLSPRNLRAGPDRSHACMETRKMSALVVDDDPVVRRVEGTLLGRYGLETKAVENGREAVDLFVAGNSFDLVLMDMEMPIMDGPKATRMLRGMGVRCMIVGVTAGGDKAAFAAAGLDFCWDKPLKAQGVVAILDELAKKLC